MKISIAARSDVGLERSNNEDAFVFCPNLAAQDWNEPTVGYVMHDDGPGTLAVVADGMGGANAGETASALALETIRARFRVDDIAHLLASEDRICPFLESCVRAANDAIVKRMESDPDTLGMGTTLVLLWLVGRKAYIAWCGDSRCYVFNPRSGLKCLTRDHSVVQELIDRHEITSEQAYSHPDSNVITRCLGDSDASSSPETVVYEICSGDTFLLCSDGLCGYCRDKEIAKVLYSRFRDVDACSEALIDRALAVGGFDNITVILLSVVGERLPGVRIPFLRRLRNLFSR